MLAVKAIGYYIFRGANGQKDQFRYDCLHSLQSCMHAVAYASKDEVAPNVYVVFGIPLVLIKLAVG